MYDVRTFKMGQIQRKHKQPSEHVISEDRTACDEIYGHVSLTGIAKSIPFAD